MAVSTGVSSRRESQGVGSPSSSTSHYKTLKGHNTQHSGQTGKNF